MVDHESMAWNEAAASGALSDFDGDPPLRLRRTTVSWMSARLGNDTEAIASVGVFRTVAKTAAVVAAVFVWCLLAGVI